MTLKYCASQVPSPEGTEEPSAAGPRHMHPVSGAPDASRTAASRLPTVHDGLLLPHPTSRLELLAVRICYCACSLCVHVYRLCLRQLETDCVRDLRSRQLERVRDRQRERAREREQERGRGSGRDLHVEGNRTAVNRAHLRYEHAQSHLNLASEPGTEMFCRPHSLSTTPRSPSATWPSEVSEPER